MSEEIEKYYKLLGVTENMPKKDIYKVYVTKKDELLKKKENNEITVEEYDKELKDLELAYVTITIENNNLSFKKNVEDEGTETETLEEQLKHAMEKESASDITVKRGRLIRKIQAEIKKIKSTENLSGADIENLKKLEELLSNEIDNHKHQLSTRYKNEFLEKKATVRAIFTTLPKGMGLQIKKISNCINELKQAKSNKERIFGMVDLAKSFGMLAATPVIFTVKFVVQHWYLLLLLLLLLQNIKLPNLKNNNEKDNSYQEQPEPEVAESFELETGVDKEKVPNLEPVKKPVLVNDSVKESTSTTPSRDYEIDKSGNLVAPKKPVLNPQVNIQEDKSLGKVPNVDNSGVLETVTDNTNQELTVINSSAKEEYFNLLRQALPTNLNDSYTVFDTYQDAVQYCVNEFGYTVKEAQDILSGNSVIEKPSIMWLVGEGGFFADSEVEMLQNYTKEQLTKMIEDNQDLVDKAVNMHNSGNSVSEIFGNLGTGGLVLFTCYELLQYGLAIPTDGLSLLLPG